MSLSNNFPAVRPTLLLDFASARRLDPRITFTRATTATYYDGVTKALAEQNLFLYSQEFNQADWAQSGVTVSANSSIAPDGTVTADSIIPTAVSGQFKELQQNFLATSGLTYAFSIFLKADGYDFVQLVGTSATFGTFAINYDLSTGVETQFSAGTSTVVSRSITDVGSGWYRVSVVTTAIGTGAARLAFNVIPASTSARGVTWTGDGGSGVAAWGAQIEQRGTVTAYTVTTTAVVSNYQPVLVTAEANVARFDFNPVTDVSLGLLIEDARTNLLTYSSEFANASWSKVDIALTSNTIVAPNGTITGTKYIPNSLTTAKFLNKNHSVSAGTALTFSLYIKAGEYNNCVLYFDGLSTGRYGALFDLSNQTTTVGSLNTAGTATGFQSITAVGNGWFRCVVGFTDTALNDGAVSTTVRYTAGAAGYNAVAGNDFSGFYIWGAQLEAGAFVTSYIATVATTVPRNADSAVMTGTNFTSWFNPNEGTMYVEAASVATDSVQRRALSVNDATTSNFIDVSRIGSTAQSRAVVVTNGTSVFNSLNSAWAVNTFAKVANAYKVNDFAAILNNNAIRTDNDGVLPVVSRLVIGDITTFNPWVGTISKIAYYDSRLTNTQLQALTLS